MLVVSPYISNGFDSDTITYINAVEGADNQTLEWSTRMAFDRFIKGCKADNIWDAIKASCILAGARTLDGALTPLKGASPTNYNFVSGDYNRKTGLKGDGTTKYIDTNRDVTADPQDNYHLGVNITTLGTTSFMNDIGGYFPCDIYRSGGSYFYRVKSNGSVELTIGTSTGFACGVRTSSTSVNAVYGTLAGSSNALNSTSITAGNVFVFARNSATGAFSVSDARLSFYAIGESLNASLYEARVKQLMSDINNAF